MTWASLRRRRRPECSAWRTGCVWPAHARCRRPRAKTKRPSRPSDDLEAAFADATFAPPSLVLVSGLTGRAVESGDTLDGPYWRRQAHEPTAFAEYVGTLAALGVEVVVEVGPSAVLGPAVAGAWPDPADARRAPIVLSSLQQEVSGSTADSGFVAAVAKAYESGIDVSFTGLFAGETRRRIPLPSYPFQRRRHWIKESSRAPR